MANTFKYENQAWGEPIANERLSTNSYYTGQRLGTPTQDAATTGGSNTDPYIVEANTVRFGTVLQDTVEGSTPKLVKPSEDGETSKE